MFAACKDCGFDSGDCDTLDEIRVVVLLAGGQRDIEADGYWTAECPDCGSSRMTID